MNVMQDRPSPIIGSSNCAMLGMDSLALTARAMAGSAVLWLLFGHRKQPAGI